MCTQTSVYIIPVVTAMGTVGLFSCSAPSYAIACRATQGAGHASMQMDTQGGVGAALLVAVRVSVRGAQFSQTGVFPCHRHHGGPSLLFHHSFSIPSASSSTILSIIKIYSKHTREKNLSAIGMLWCIATRTNKNHDLFIKLYPWILIYQYSIY